MLRLNPRSLAGRAVAVAALIVFLLVTGVFVIAPRITLPLPDDGEWAERIAEVTGLPVRATGVSWSGRDHITFHGVEFYGGDGYPLTGSAEQVTVAISSADVLPWMEAPEDRVVQVSGAHLQLTDTAEGWLNALAPLLNDGLPPVETARLVIGDGTLAVEGARLGGDRGEAEIDLLAQGAGSHMKVRWHVRAARWTWDSSPWASVAGPGVLGDPSQVFAGPYDIRDAEASGTWETEGPLQVQHLAARLVDELGIRRVQASGTVAPDGSLALDIVATGLALPDDVPPLAAWGIAGAARVEGHVSGKGDGLRLDGAVGVGPGTLWHQSVDEARATIALTPRALTVDASEIEKGPSLYEIAGTLLFPGNPASPGQPAGADGAADLFSAEGALDLTLRTEAGRAETLLDVLGWSSWPLTGSVDGVLRFRGPLGSLESEGAVTLADGSGWHQPFDELSAEYRWNRRALVLTDGLFRLRGGRGEFAGEVDENGLLDIAIESVGLPLESLEAVRQAGRDLLAGRIGFHGRVRGTLAEPQWEGRVQGTGLAMAGLQFERGGGELAQSRGVWEVRNLVLERASGAEYSVTGWVDASPAEPPLVHLLVDVDGEQLEEALALMGVRLAYPLASGRVAGRSLFIGELSRPDGEILLDVTDAFLAGRPTGLSVELDVAGGQVKVRHLRLGEPEQDAG